MKIYKISLFMYRAVSWIWMVILRNIPERLDQLFDNQNFEVITSKNVQACYIP